MHWEHWRFDSKSNLEETFFFKFTDYFTDSEEKRILGLKKNKKKKIAVSVFFFPNLNIYYIT